MREFKQSGFELEDETDWWRNLESIKIEKTPLNSIILSGSPRHLLHAELLMMTLYGGAGPVKQ
jgi:hypothetical protein